VTEERREKPYPSFPLSWHRTGYWYRRIERKVYYFGKRWGSAEDALEDYLKRRDNLDGPKSHKTQHNALTVQLMCNYYLDAKDRQRSNGELSDRTFVDMRQQAEILVKLLGKSRLVESMGPDDFGHLRQRLSEGVSAYTLATRIRRTRTIFLFAENDQLIPGKVRFGTQFRTLSKKLLRKDRQQRVIEHGVRAFTADQIKLMIASTRNLQLKAMILLGVNCGYGNTDVSELHCQHIQGDWVIYPRVKTSVDRIAWLWPETREALRAWIGDRDTGRVFFRGESNPWVRNTLASVNDGVAKEIVKLLVKANMRRPGLSFYALRHTFQTIADGAKDQVAVAHVMGHVDGSMAGIYRESIERERVKAVCEHVRAWYLAGD